MATSTIKRTKDFHIISGTYTVNEGYFSVVAPYIHVGDSIFAQILRGDNTEWNGLFAVPRISDNGYAHIYIRDKSGSAPTNGITVQANILVGGVNRCLLSAHMPGAQHDLNDKKTEQCDGVHRRFKRLDRRNVLLLLAQCDQRSFSSRNVVQYSICSRWKGNADIPDLCWNDFYKSEKLGMVRLENGDLKLSISERRCA